MQHTTPDAGQLARGVTEAPPINLLAGTLFLLALAAVLVVVLLLRRSSSGKSTLELEPRRQGLPFVATTKSEDRTEPLPTTPCCTVAEAVRDYFADPPRSLLEALSEIVAESAALDRIEAEMDEKLETRLKEHRQETDLALQNHRQEVSAMLLSHVGQVTAAVAATNKAHNDEVLAAIRGLRA